MLLALLIIAGPAAAQVVVRSSLKPESGVVLGQHVRVLVDVLFPGDMPRPPRVSMPDIPGAQILRYESQATTMNERIDGKDHVGQRFEFALYPRRGGTVEVPAPQVTLFDGAGEETGRLTGTPTKFEVAVPSGIDPSKPVVATSELALEQRWQPDPAGSIKAGDALVRTIVRRATDIPGMAMLDLAFVAPPGVRVYVDPPHSDDSIERGDIVGRRTDRVTYVFERGGSFPIDAVVQPWWDLRTSRLRRAEGQGITVAVTTAPSPSPPGAAFELSLYVATTSMGLLALGWWTLPRVRSAYARRHARWQASEAKAFRDLQQACRNGDLTAVYRAFTIWRQRSDRAPELTSFAEEIERAVFGVGSWSAAQSRDLAGRLSAWRRPSRRTSTTNALPPLNPERIAVGSQTSG